MRALLFAVLCAMNIAGLCQQPAVSAAVSAKTNTLGAPVLLIVVRALNDHTNIAFSCCVEQMWRTNLWVELAPTLTAKRPKPAEERYLLKASQTSLALKWDYSRAPAYYQPRLGATYRFRIDIKSPRTSSLHSESFTFTTNSVALAPKKVEQQ